MTPAKVRARFYWSIRLLLAGLAVQLVSLFGLHHPLGFMLFSGVGMTLVGLGVLIFIASLLSLVRRPEPEPEAAE